jgi:phage shock protein A
MPPKPSRTKSPDEDRTTMSLFQKLLTLIRGTAIEAGQSVVDRNAIRILDQEMRDAQNALVQSRDDLAKIMAQRNLAGRKLDDKLAKAAEYEGYVRSAFAKGDEALARDVAVKLAPIEADIKTERQMMSTFDESIRTLQSAIRQTETNLGRLKQQVDTVKVTESVQRAQASIAARHSGSNSKMRTALDSLERVKERQAEHSARLEAAHELAEADGDVELRARLAQAGLLEDNSSADSILARIQQEQPKQIAHDPQRKLSHDKSDPPA